MAHNLKCPDCGHPVGWDVNQGECPRNMQNYQSDECKARQIAWLKEKLDAALKCLAAAESTVARFTTSNVYNTAKATLSEVLALPSPVRIGRRRTSTPPDSCTDT